MEEWFENYADKGFGLQKDETGQDEARFIERALHLRKGQSVLDVPCGAGRVLIHLAKVGCRVAGVDLSEAFIQRARERFAKEGVEGEFHAVDMRQMELQERFDAVFNWQGSFGYFGEAENLDVLGRFARALRVGGRLLIDQPNREYLLRHFAEERERDGLIIRNRWDRRSQRIESIWTHTIDGQRRSYPLSMRLYTPAQFRAMFKQTGMEMQTVYGDIAGEAYRRSSKRLVVVGRKV